ncbi:MAG: slipin family protein [Firmicutes bacterium]|nr:slipin family protein [Bacillota bacterium]
MVKSSAGFARIQVPSRRVHPISAALFAVVFIPGLIWGIYQYQPFIAVASLLIATLASSAVKVSQQWEKAVVLRLGKFKKLSGPGPFLIIPVVDTVSSWIDQRIIATPFNAEQTLTKDTVPVDVDAVLFWMVWDAEKAALEVESYKDAVAWASQTALRDIIGKTQLSELLAGREHIDDELRRIIDLRTVPWGISVQSVEIRDVSIPKSLQDAMSREAQAERERKARVILGTAETEISAKFAEAAKDYENNPVALHLRAMNMLYEGLKEKGALVVVPSTAVETMGLGTITGLTSLTRYPVAEKNKD